MKKLSTKQLMLVEFIEYYIKDNKFPPTLEEIASVFSVSKQSIFYMVQRLEEKGYLATKAGKARTIKVLKSVLND